MTSSRTLASVCELIVDCPHKTAPESSDAYAYAVGTKAVRDGRIDFSQARPVDEATYSAWISRAVPREGDLILCREAPVGPVARIPALPRVCLGQRTVLLRPDRTQVDPDYLLYALLAPHVQAALQTLSEGSTVPHLNVADVRRFELALPPLAEQRVVARVLRTLDEKVDSNGRLTMVLRETAATAFRGWFVDLVGASDLQDGLPAGWRFGTLGELATIIKGNIQPSKSPDQVFQQYSIPAFDTGEGPEVAPGATMLSAKTPLPEDDCVLLSKLNPTSKRVWWPRPSQEAGRPVCSPEFLVLAPREQVPNSYLFALISSDERFYNELLGHATGTTGSRQRVKPADALACKALIPREDALRRWDAFARPLYDHADGLVAESRHVIALRRQLLTKLIGRPRIEEATYGAMAA